VVTVNQSGVLENTGAARTGKITVTVTTSTGAVLTALVYTVEQAAAAAIPALTLNLAQSSIQFAYDATTPVTVATLEGAVTDVTYSATPSNGNFTVACDATTGAVTVTPLAANAKTVALTTEVKVIAKRGTEIVTATFTVTQAAAPVAVAPALTLSETAVSFLATDDSTVDVTVAILDYDGANNGYGVATGASWFTVAENTGVITITPKAINNTGSARTGQVTVTATGNTSGLTTSKTITVSQAASTGTGVTPALAVLNVGPGSISGITVANLVNNPKGATVEITNVTGPMFANMTPTSVDITANVLNQERQGSIALSATLNGIVETMSVAVVQAAGSSSLSIGSASAGWEQQNGTTAIVGMAGGQTASVTAKSADLTAANVNGSNVEWTVPENLDGAAKNYTATIEVTDGFTPQYLTLVINQAARPAPAYTGSQSITVAIRDQNISSAVGAVTAGVTGIDPTSLNSINPTRGTTTVASVAIDPNTGVVTYTFSGPAQVGDLFSATFDLVSGNQTSVPVTVNFEVPVPTPDFTPTSANPVPIVIGDSFVDMTNALTEGITAYNITDRVGSATGTGVDNLVISGTDLRFNFNKGAEAGDEFQVTFSIGTVDGQPSATDYTVIFKVQ
jgi:hypothetical protein